MNVRDISIGELAERAGCTVQIIRHYEKIGLLPDTRRTSGNRRIYSEDQASRLIFIRHSRELGFSLDDIRQLLSFSNQPEQSCEQVDAIAREHLHGVQERLGRLRFMAGTQRIILFTRHKAARIQAAFHTLANKVIHLFAHSAKCRCSTICHLCNICDEI